MNFPVTIQITHHPILLHGICEFVGIFVAFRYYLWLKRRQGDTVESMNRLYVVIAATLGAVGGSHLLGALENIPEWRSSPHFWIYLYSNKTLVGGIIGALICVELVKKVIGERQNTGDLFTYPLMLGMIIGRIGCFSAGVYEQTYGYSSRLPWAMDLGDGILRQPVALYEIVFLMLLWAALIMVQRRYVLEQGALFKLFIISYLLFRFLLDFIKPGWRYFFGLGSIQLTCIAGLLYYYRYIVNPSLLIVSKRVYAC